jgi:hypothetical protein
LAIFVQLFTVRLLEAVVAPATIEAEEPVNKTYLEEGAWGDRDNWEDLSS